jgi:hypothetical protein
MDAVIMTKRKIVMIELLLKPAIKSSALTTPVSTKAAAVNRNTNEVLKRSKTKTTTIAKIMTRTA